MDPLKHVPILILSAAALLCLTILLVLSRNKRSKINMADLFLGEDGTMSRSAFVLLASYGVTSWGMVYMWLNDKMTEGYFSAYLAAWVAPAVTKLIVNANVAKAAVQGPIGPTGTIVAPNATTLGDIKT